MSYSVLGAGGSKAGHAFQESVHAAWRLAIEVRLCLCCEVPGAARNRTCTLYQHLTTSPAPSAS
jgi:hypothetical protein